MYVYVQIFNRLSNASAHIQGHSDRMDTNYRGADKYSARPGRKQATATEDFDFHTTYL